MLRVSGLDLNQSDHSDQVKKLLKYVADVSRKIEERHQVCIAIILIKQYYKYYMLFSRPTGWRMCLVRSSSTSASA